MKKPNILLAFILTLLFSLSVGAQTTELVYSLGNSGTPASTISIASIATDASDNIFICGSFNGTNVNFNPLVPGSDSVRTSQSTGVSKDGFVAKYNSAGQLLKVIAFGNTSNDEGRKVYVDAAGNVYLLATIIGANIRFENTSAGFPPTAGSGAMALAKYNNNLALQVSRLIGKTNGTNLTITGATGDLLNDVKVVGTDVYVTGALFNSTVNFNQAGPAKYLSTNGSTDIFVAKYDASLICMEAFNVGGANGDEGNGIDLDGSGNIYVTGIFRGQNINLDPLGSKLVSEYGGGAVTNGDAFFAKYNSAMNNCVWAFNIGAASIDQGKSIIVEKSASPNVYIGGTVGSDINNVDFNPSTTDAVLYSLKGGTDLFVASYTGATGAYRWHVANGSTGNEYVSSMAFDAGGNILFSGFASGTIDFGNSKIITGKGGRDAYFAVLANSSGLPTAAYNVGGSGDEQGNDVTVSSTGKVLLAGDLSGNGDYDPSTAIKTITKLGVQDGFIARYVLCTPPSISTQPADVTKCEGLAASFSVTASGATTYQWKKGGAPISNATNSTYSIAALATTDAGNYTVDVTNSCQTVTSSIAAVTVNPKPIISSAVTGSVCSSVSQNYAITSLVPSSYAWTRAVVAGITTAFAGSGSTSPITETLTNTTNTPIVVRYVITPTSTTGTCVGAPFNYDVTVNPKPAITSTAAGIVCSGIAQNYAIISSVASTYSWSRAAVAGILNPAVGLQTSSTITEALINNSVAPVVVQYVITPTSVTGSCAGASFNYTVTVNPSVVPNVTATVSPSNSICAGKNVTFTATPGNAGSAPLYQWNKGGMPISGATDITYSSATVANNDSYTVTLTSNAPCASPATDVSNPIVMNVTANVTPTVSITVSPSNTICAGSNITFSTVTGNPGTSPTYQWKKGGLDITGATNATYSTTAAANLDSYSVEMTSSISCATTPTVTSNSIVTTVNPKVVPTVSASSSSVSICSGESITLAANATGGGSPTYRWKSGSTYIAGASSATYTTTTTTNNESYSVEMTSTAACASPATVTSAGVVIAVSSNAIPSVTATSSATTICPGNSITLTATPGNGGTTPTYRWKLGSSYIAGASSVTYTTTTAVNGNSYSVEMTSSLPCATTPTATTSPIVITVNSIPVPAVSISADNSIICTGTNVKFTATPTDGGAAPTYQWKKGGVNITGATNAIFNTTTAANNDSYSVEMVSNASCLTSTTPVNSSSIVITITAAPTPAVMITSDPGISICAGKNVTFTASVSNGGTPTYQWKKGAAPIPGATNATYSSSAIANGNAFSVDIISTLSCLTTPNASSNTITMTVNPVVVPSVSITTPKSTICEGNTVVFTAIPVNEGTPTYKWKKGSAYIPGAVDATYTISTAAQGDSYSVEMTNSSACAIPATVTSNSIVMAVNPVVASSVTIAVNKNAICAGENITFNATAIGGGAPTYRWKQDGSYIAGASSSTYSTTSAVNNGNYTVEMTSTLACPSQQVSTSPSIVISVTPVTVPAISISSSTSTPICPGGSITFTSTQTGGGIPTYRWKLGSTYIPGASSASFTTTTAENGNSFSVEMASTVNCATPGSVTSSPIVVSVNPTLVPVVSIAASSTTICAGLPVTFTATAVDGGAAPTYQWKKGSTDISGATAATYSTNAAVDGDSYTVEMTSNALCAAPTKVFSNAVVMNVNPALIPSVSITANNSVICTGTNVKFDATPINGGGAPTYKWKLGTAYIAGATNASYSTTAATNNQSYSVEMVSSANCASTLPVTSNNVVITITTSPNATVSITSPGNEICAGNTLKLTAVPGNGGTNPTYKWYLNGTPVPGATNVNYSSSSFVDGDKVHVDIVSNSSCVSNPNASSEDVTIKVNPILTPSVTITSSGATICSGESVSFTAVSVNGGTPLYQWKAGTVNISGATNETFTSTTLTNGNGISVEMTSTAVCGLPTTVSSNTIVMAVTPKVVPTISITASSTSICPGDNVTLTANQTGGGAPSYKWKLAGADIDGATSATYVTSTAVNNNSYTVELTSSAICATPIVVTSAATVVTVKSITEITLQPAAQSVCAIGNAATFSVAATGSNLTYQWKQVSTILSNNATFSGVQTKYLIVSNVSNAELKSYSVTVTGGCGVVTSDPVNLTLSTAPISISTQPVAQTLVPGSTLSLSVVASGPSVSYQWQRNGSAISNDSRISGANSSTLTITNAQVSDNFNDYVCILSSPCAATINSNSVSVIVSSTTAVHIAQAQGFKVSPNPSAGTFALTNDFTPFDVEQIEIVSLNGVVVLTKAISGGTHLDEMIEASELASGMYLMIIKGHGQQALVKIAIDR